MILKAKTPIEHENPKCVDQRKAELYAKFLEQRRCSLLWQYEVGEIINRWCDEDQSDSAVLKGIANGEGCRLGSLRSSSRLAREWNKQDVVFAHKMANHLGVDLGVGDFLRCSGLEEAPFRLSVLMSHVIYQHQSHLGDFDVLMQGGDE
jgi:hypothetical protein